MPSEETQTLTIRSLTPTLVEAIDQAAETSSRSRDKQILHIIKNWAAQRFPPEDYRQALARRLAVALNNTQEAHGDETPLIHDEHLTESKTAEVAGVSVDATMDAFQARATPSFDVLDRLAEVLGVMPEWLKHGIGQAYRESLANWSIMTPDDMIESWLTSKYGDVGSVHIVRIDNPDRRVAIIKQLWNTFACDITVPECDLTGSNAASIRLFEALGRLFRNPDYEDLRPMVTGHRIALSGWNQIRDPISPCHPIQALNRYGQQSRWIHDVWRSEQDELPEYWPGQKALSRQIIGAWAAESSKAQI